MEPDDVVIADIEGQTLDIFLHGPEFAHENGIVKAFTHTSIRPCTLLKMFYKKINSPNMPSFTCPLLSSVVVGDGQEVWQMLLSTAPRQRPSRLDITDKKHL